MLLALDVGNSNIVIGLFTQAVGEAESALAAHWRIATPQQQTADELSVTLHELFSLSGVSREDVTGIVISSVVPPVESLLRRVCEGFFHLRPLFIEPGVKTGMPILTDNPGEVGADRIVNSVAGFARLGGPCIIVDMGTATTFDVVSARGEFIGGAIAPGLGISADALFRNGARLPRVDVRKPAKVIGTGTIDNLQIGLYYGYIGLVDGILERLIAELGQGTRVIATGGLGRLIAEGCKHIESYDEMLTLTGLRLVWERNAEKQRRR